MPPKGAILKAAQEALESKSWDEVLRLCDQVPSPSPYPILVCRGLAATGLQQWEVRETGKKHGHHVDPTRSYQYDDDDNDSNHLITHHHHGNRT